MRSTRFATALLLLALAVGALAWAWTQPGSETAGAGLHAIEVVGPGGEALFNGTVLADPATPLGALQAAGREAGFEVRVRSYGAYGGRACDGQYVESIAGHAAAGGAGWVYSIWRAAAGGWQPSPAESAACPALLPGDRVAWRYVEGSGV